MSLQNLSATQMLQQRLGPQPFAQQLLEQESATPLPCMLPMRPNLAVL
jgi:hypothetical protein